MRTSPGLGGGTNGGCTGDNCGGGGGRFLIPVTGFAPGVFTPLGAGPEVPYQENTGSDAADPRS